MIAYANIGGRHLYVCTDQGRTVERCPLNDDQELDEALSRAGFERVEPWRDPSATGIWIANVAPVEPKPTEQAEAPRAEDHSERIEYARKVADLMVEFGGRITAGHHRIDPRAGAINMLREHGLLDGNEATAIADHTTRVTIDLEHLPPAIHDEVCRTWQRVDVADPHAAWRLVERRNAPGLQHVGVELTGWSLVEDHLLHLHEPNGDVTRFTVFTGTDRLNGLAAKIVEAGS